MKVPPLDIGPCNIQHLLLDMPVRWSSTFVMLFRAWKLKSVHILCFIISSSISVGLHQVVNQFVSELASDETNHDKQEKLLNLKLYENEWDNVGTFSKILQVNLPVNLPLSSVLTCLRLQTMPNSNVPQTVIPLSISVY